MFQSEVKQNSWNQLMQMQLQFLEYQELSLVVGFHSSVFILKNVVIRSLFY